MIRKATVEEIRARRETTGEGLAACKQAINRELRIEALKQLRRKARSPSAWHAEIIGEILDILIDMETDQ